MKKWSEAEIEDLTISETAGGYRGPQGGCGRPGQGPNNNPCGWQPGSFENPCQGGNGWGQPGTNQGGNDSWGKMS